MADPFLIGARIAFARRVGLLVDAPGAARFLKGMRVRFRAFDISGRQSPPDPGDYLRGVDARIDLRNPEYELTLVRDKDDYLAVTSPGTMMQGWSQRKPRSRAFFHPAAIFPKLSRALVNMTGCKRGDLFLDPFAGTGSLPIEADLVGAKVAALDQSEAMARGALANMKRYGQEWLCTVRADSAFLPFVRVDAMATDIPYGRASSTRGRTSREILESFLPSAAASIRPGSRLVLMHQKEVQVEGGSEFDLLEEHHLQVHKLLTRTISILRRR